ncbi:ubiquitin carboxyl-terminal hydrolase CYLD isoform X2 [Betta splendens]|nr:ubiquitin carboxyl-terminal hydrolase CYLD isoform X2 [Betta splendens]
MEAKAVEGDAFFIVTRGRSRKGFCRGCVGRVEGETPSGELLGLVYNGGRPKSRGIVRTENTCPLTRHQAQLLLFVTTPSKRLELLCNAPLFKAICDLSQDDVVVVKHKKGPQPGRVKNLMQIGRKESDDELHMLGFEVEFVDSDHTLSSKKPVPLPMFNAADIIRVVPSASVPLGLHWKNGQYGALNKKAVTRISSMPSAGPTGNPRHVKDGKEPRRARGPAAAALEVGSMVEVVSSSGVTVYGVVRWLGVPLRKTEEWAGIELDYEVTGCSDGKYGNQRYFTCKANTALFVPVTKCSPDSRFACSSMGPETRRSTDTPPVPSFDDSAEYAPPIPESEALSLLVGRMKGIQGHVNSCYLDATLFSLFSSSVTLDNIWQRPAEAEQPITCSLRSIVSCLRRQGFVPAESVTSFRKELGCNTFQTDEKDPEEFITVLFQKVLCIEPLLKLRSRGETSQGSYTFQIIVEKEQMGQVPTVQQLLDTSCLSSDLKFEEVPSCLMVQMPRFGNKYKMFNHIIPSTELDITDLLHNSPRECFVCGCLAQYECFHCLPDRKLQPGRIKQYCSVCNTQVHSHPSRQGHSPKALEVPADVPCDTPVPRHVMQLFAVLCIQTSHYVAYVKYGPDPNSWLFFDSMADRCGDDQSGYNIPEVQACSEIGIFLAQPEEELARASPSQAPELVRRLLCDSYMFLYQNPATPSSKPSHEE